MCLAIPGKLIELLHLREQRVGARGDVLIDLAQRESDMDQHVVAGFDLRRIFEADLLDDAAEVGLAHSHTLRTLSDFEP